jgi:ABC-type nickel/cobalt efflux system permease component RcnA
MRRVALAGGVLAAAVVGLVLVPSTPASAHPLGNFSVNQYVGLTLHPDRLDAAVVVDLAEIPTLQDRPTVDGDRSATVSDTERAAHAADRCAAVATAVRAAVDGSPLAWTVTAADFAYAAGTGGLDVSRLTCALSAAGRLTDGATVSVENAYLAGRIGWREMAAVGDGVALVDSPLPTASVTDELRAYPTDPLAAPLDVRSATLRVSGSPTPGDAPTAPGDAAADAAMTGGGDPVSRWMATMDRQFQSLAGGTLTPLVVLLTIGLALLLGAGHAALPGHGKTVLAAYLAGKRGRPRDAVTVAGTVTLTHTGGVLVLGLLLSIGTAVAGEQVLGWLGLASGILVLAVGTAMLLAVLRRHAGAPSYRLARYRVPLLSRWLDGHGHSHGPGGHTHGPDGHHHHNHGASKQHDHREHDHEHDHAHDPGRGHAHDHGRGHGRGHAHEHFADGYHTHPGHHDHDHDHHDHVGSVEHLTPSRPPKGRSVQQLPGSPVKGRSRMGLAGIGIAGGLVPSPSALIVLLAAIGLGRAGYGIVLVVVYGIGMALTLTGAGLLLLTMQRRLARRAAENRDHKGVAARLSRIAARLNAATPAATASLVLLVGAGLAARAAAGIV